MKTLIQTSKVLILSIAVLTAVSYVQAAWSNPTQAPTGGNTAAPINVSSSNQDKAGGFSAASLLGDKLTAVNEICLGGDCIESWPGGGGSVDTTNLQNRVTGTCSVGQSIIEINEDGTVVCGEIDTSPSGTLCGIVTTSFEGSTSGIVTTTCSYDGYQYYPGIRECKYIDAGSGCGKNKRPGCPNTHIELKFAAPGGGAINTCVKYY